MEMEKRTRAIRLMKSVLISSAKDGEKVLDLGCGDCYLKQLLPNVDYTGIDFMANMKFYNYPKDAYKNIINWNLEKGLPPKIRKKKFDLIFINELIEHVENFKTLLIQCRKILTDKGKIIISTPSNNRFIIKEDPSHIHCFRKTNMANLAKICGLKLTKSLGAYICIPILHLFISSNQTLYTNHIIYRLEKAC